MLSKFNKAKSSPEESAAWFIDVCSVEVWTQLMKNLRFCPEGRTLISCFYLIHITLQLHNCAFFRLTISRTTLAMQVNPIILLYWVLPAEHCIFTSYCDGVEISRNWVELFQDIPHNIKTHSGMSYGFSLVYIWRRYGLQRIRCVHHCVYCIEITLKCACAFSSLLTSYLWVTSHVFDKTLFRLGLGGRW